MHTANKIAVIAGSALLVAGISLMVNPQVGAAMDAFATQPGLLWVTGLVTFVSGVIVLSLYNTWSKSWLVLVTIVGWLSVIKGAVLMLFPQVMTFYADLFSPVMLEGSGIYAAAFGCVLLLVGFRK